ncbi:MAG: DUF2914 domain-containing protein [Rhodothermales bacterium]
MLIAHLTQFWNRHERWLGMLFFVSGIIWDLLTLRRIDNWVDNTILLSYYVVLAAVVVAHGNLVGGKRVVPWLIRFRHWIRPAIQFLLGALLSGLVIFYARSITWTTGSAYWGALVIGLVANEILLRRRVSYQALVVMIFLVGATIAGYLVPVVAGRLGLDLYRVALVIALLPAGLLVTLGVRLQAFRSHGRMVWTVILLAVLPVLLDTAYRHNWIPPVPLAVQAGGIYESSQRDGDEFVLTWRSDDFHLFRRDYDRDVYWTPGDTVYAFSAVFAPTGLTERIYHVWQQRQNDAWVSTDRIGYAVKGGRDGGYRGVTFKSQVRPGDWRVLVETSDGRTLTRIPFTVIEATPENRPNRVLERRF